MKHTDMTTEFRPFLRKQCEQATCQQCTCACKGVRKGCGQFTPTPKFYDEVREKFNTTRSEKSVPAQDIVELAVSMKGGNNGMEANAV
mgnify:CR=1 FL=1